MANIQSFRIYDTTLQISTVHNPPPKDKRVACWGPGFRSPDWETFNRLLDVLRAKGFAIGHDPWHDKYPTLSKFHRLVSIGTPHGDLYAHCETSPNGCSFEFFQETVTSNRNGGRFDFDKLKRMPYLVRKKFEGAVNSMTTHLVARGFTKTVQIDTPVQVMPIMRRLNIAEGTAAPVLEAELSAAAMAFFNDKWDGEYDRKRGTHRFHRGTDGWPSERELACYGGGNRDRDGHLIGHGEHRLFRLHDGRLRRGRVYGGINGMWMTVYGPGRNDVTHLSSKELFSGDPRTLPRRLKKARPLTAVLESAIKCQDFERAIVLRDLIARTTPTRQAA
ncbi:hypothetical protein ACVIGB_000723 [Bradyrhizobium sp. USDA 4341]